MKKNDESTNRAVIALQTHVSPPSEDLRHRISKFHFEIKVDGDDDCNHCNHKKQSKDLTENNFYFSRRYLRKLKIIF